MFLTWYNCLNFYDHVIFVSLIKIKNYDHVFIFQIIGSGPELRIVVRPDTAGLYICVATVRERDFEFPKLEGRVRVLIKGPPQIVSSAEQLGRMGDTVNIECSTVSIPSPIQITWMYKGREIDLSK